MSKTAIEWTDFTVNPIRARNLETGAVGHFCEKISPGCAHCYASALQKRFRMPNFPGANKRLPTMPLVTDRATVQINERLEVFLDENVLRQVLRRRKPTKFFWCDMTDLLGSWVPDEWIDRCLAVMALTGQHIHQVLTKRAERLPAYFAPGRSDQIYQAVQQLAEQYGIADYLFDDWPWPNVWLGVSGEDQPRINERHAFLSSTVAGVHFWSLEPL